MAAVVCVLAVTGSPCLAQSNSWTATASGFWDDTGSWSLGVLPDDTQSSTLITNATTKTVTIDDLTASDFPYSLTISNLLLNGGGTTINTLLLQDTFLAGPSAGLQILNAGTIDNRGVCIVSNSLLSIAGICALNGDLKLLDGTVDLSTGALVIGPGIAGNRTLTINGGTLAADVLTVAPTFGSQGAVVLTGGNLLVDQLSVTNGGGLFVFNAGTLDCGVISINNGLPFLVGDGTSAARVILEGGVYSFGNSLHLHNNATLTGCGLLLGDLNVDAGATVVADCGGTLTVTGSLTNNGLLRVVNGTTLETYGAVVNLGTIEALYGNASFYFTFLNNGAFITSNSLPRVLATAINGTNVTVRFTTDNRVGYTVESATNLVPTAWSTLTNLTGNGSAMTVTNLGGAKVTKRFYRVGLVLP